MSPATTDAKRECREDARRAIEQRRAILGPCLAAMGFSEHGAPPPELPDRLKFHGAEIPLEPWERNVLLGDAGDNAAVLLAHFAEGIAFRAISASWLTGAEREPSRAQGADRTSAAMIDEIAAGMALQQEIQRDIDRLVGTGEMGDAKKMTGFRRKIDHALAQMEERAGVQAQEQAQALSVGLLTPRDTGQAPGKRMAPPIEKSLTLEDLYTLEETIDKEIAATPEEPNADELFEASLRKRGPGTSGDARWTDSKRPTVDTARRLRLLLGLLAVCIVAFTLLFFNNREEAPPPRLGMEHFQHIEAVLDVKPRPPSLFVRVSDPKWAALPTEEKTQLIEELGRIAGGQGYHGVQIKTSAGTNVGQWLHNSGARLIPVPEVAS